MIAKPCKICGIVKPLDEFHKMSNGKDGHRVRCKECVKAQWRDRYENDPVFRKNTHKWRRVRYRTNAEYREAFLAKLRKRYHDDPEYRQRVLDRVKRSNAKGKPTPKP